MGRKTGHQAASQYESVFFYWSGLTLKQRGMGTDTAFHSQTSGFLFHLLNNLHEALGLSPCLWHTRASLVFSLMLGELLPCLHSGFALSLKNPLTFIPMNNPFSTSFALYPVKSRLYPRHLLFPFFCPLTMGDFGFYCRYKLINHWLHCIFIYL